MYAHYTIAIPSLSYLPARLIPLVVFWISDWRARLFALNFLYASLALTYFSCICAFLPNTQPMLIIFIHDHDIVLLPHSLSRIEFQSHAHLISDFCGRFVPAPSTSARSRSFLEPSFPHESPSRTMVSPTSSAYLCRSVFMTHLHPGGFRGHCSLKGAGFIVERVNLDLTSMAIPDIWLPTTYISEEPPSLIQPSLHAHAFVLRLHQLRPAWYAKRRPCMILRRGGSRSLTSIAPTLDGGHRQQPHQRHSAVRARRKSRTAACFSCISQSNMQP